MPRGHVVVFAPPCLKKRPFTDGGVTTAAISEVVNYESDFRDPAAMQAG